MIRRILMLVCVPWAAALAGPPDSQPTAGVPATGPAASRVLVKLGDRMTITQAEFEFAARAAPGRTLNDLIFGMTQDRLFALYVQDHPELVPEAQLNARMEVWLKDRKQTLEQARAELAQEGLTYEEMCWRMHLALARGALVRVGEKKFQDKDYVRRLFDEHPEEFNGTRVVARHILFAVWPYDTPAAREATRQRLVALREDLISGKQKWEDAVWQSDCTTKHVGGNLGSFVRHLAVVDPIAKAAFALQPGEYSDVVESDLGYHIVQVMDRKPGSQPFESTTVQRELSLWLEKEPTVRALAETRQRYPVIGVQSPLPFERPRPATNPAELMMMRQARAAQLKSAPATRPK